MLPDNVKSRLCNFKFETAMSYAIQERSVLDKPSVITYDEYSLIEALNDTYGNVGGIGGSVGIIIINALENIGVTFDD